ncbi:MAG: cofactor-independent phosphoglycerate mutase [Bacillota bacterium]|jgi:2,3-bisphosphoglycerate-independent phosphoglycerate mutase
MKYIVILGDGMGDYPLKELGGKTPLMVANKPNMNQLAAQGQSGMMCTLYEDLPTGSDIANLSVLGYDPRKYYTGRSPIEALGVNIPLDETDTVFRCNLVTLTTEEPFEQKTILDHSSGKISNEEAYDLLDTIRAVFEKDGRRFYPGVSYRHIMIWKNIDYDYTMMPPHDILGQKITSYLPKGPYGPTVLEMMKKSYDILMAHPVNQKRIAAGKSPANCIWLWGEGKKPTFDSFFGRHQLQGSVITAVPLIKGLAAGMGLKSIEVEGATGEYDTNYGGKAEAALKALAQGDDFVFIHVEAPDECGHDGDIDLKVKSIEKIDEEVVKTIKMALDATHEDYKILLTPDHATPIVRRTHTIDPIPFVIYDSRKKANNPALYDEEAAKASGLYFADGYKLMDYFLQD